MNGVQLPEAMYLNNGQPIYKQRLSAKQSVEPWPNNNVGTESPVLKNYKDDLPEMVT